MRQTMATCSAITLDAKPLMQNLTIRIRGMKVASLRLRLAAMILSLGGKIAGIPLEFDSGNRIEELPADQWQMDRRVGFIAVSTHEEIEPDGTRWRTWQKLHYPD